jgi:hypothetical protein
MLLSMVEMYSIQDHAVVVFTNEVIYEVILALSFWYLMYFSLFTYCFLLFIRSWSEILSANLLLPSSGHTTVLFQHYALNLAAPF